MQGRCLYSNGRNTAEEEGNYWVVPVMGRKLTPVKELAVMTQGARPVSLQTF